MWFQTEKITTPDSIIITIIIIITFMFSENKDGFKWLLFQTFSFQIFI